MSFLKGMSIFINYFITKINIAPMNLNACSIRRSIKWLEYSVYFRVCCKEGRVGYVSKMVG